MFNTSKIQNESNSQRAVQLAQIKATVFNTSKIQNESNSQPLSVDEYFSYNCVQYVKDTK